MKTLLIFLGSLAILSSCVKNNPDPVWLEVNEWVLITNGLGDPEGMLTENITDAWVYVDNSFIGIFEVPFKIPLLVSGENKKITLYPTIKNNGISATKKIYPFMEPYEITTDLIQNDTLVITPVTKYYSQTVFHIIDFEAGANTDIIESVNSSASLIQSSDAAVRVASINDATFGRVTLNNSFPNWVARTDFTLVPPFPQLGAEIYLEIDYHSSLDVVTGVVSFYNGEVVENPNVQFNRQDPDSVTVVWRKIYIDMQTIVSGSPLGSDFQVTFESMLPSGLTEGEINIDNIKVVHL
ncbi:MAG: hypothetical protein HRT57_09020 [Crocinitomicaceae bacterium]|nr:hypothetical protein [Crocinitomicaceae bacterium]